MIRFDVFGRRIGVVREGKGWRAVMIGEGGTQRPAPAVVIPDWIEEDELTRFLADLYHESARPDRPDVIRLDG